MNKKMQQVLTVCFLLACTTAGCSIESQTTAELVSTRATSDVSTSPAPNRFVPGDPTATPPGEDINDSNYLQGKSAYEAKEYQDVLVLMERVLDADPNLAPPHWYRGMAHFYIGDYQAALKEMEQALAIDPNYALAYADRGLVHAALGNLDRAADDWQRALSIDPSLTKVHHNIGIMYFRQGDYYRALEEWDLSVTIDSGRATTWNDRSEALLELGQHDECIASADRAINLEPELWNAYYNRGSCRAHIGDYSAAESDLLIYVDAVPDDPWGWYNLGLTYRYMGDNQKAVVYYDQAIALDSAFTWALINRGNAYIDLEEYDLAMADYEAVLVQGEIPAAYMGRGDGHYGLEHYDEAINDYLRVIELLPNFDDAYSRLARAYLAKNLFQEAIKAANRALMLDSDGVNKPFNLQTRGRAYYEQGDYEQAIKDLSETIEIRPSVMDFYYRGIAYQANGQKENAIDDLQHFVLFATSQGLDTEKIDDAQTRLDELKE